ncbi:MAG: hypothetical protein WA755_06070 [Candidatus Acidiferrales bacterium]
MNSFALLSRFVKRPAAAAAVPAILVLFLVALPARSAGDVATVTFRKIFKQSYPEYVEIKVSENGSAVYDIRQLDESASPESFEISRPLVDRIFLLAAQLHHFDGIDLDVHRKIANLGQKTFRYEKAGEAHEVMFNYTLDATANQLLDIFEGLGRQQTDLENLVRAMRYDRLGVNDALLRLEGDYNSKILPEPQRLLPALDQLAADDKYIDIARQRARTLASHIRNTHS